ncbi:oligopeptide transport system substrate-binding protein [Crossiella equi]|uniref:Oligopeptide transport system substrate-binding protein n=1 Tax=Crossiella equi TaxID=130796 RepID=A0ABS5AID8_9PSEU|nr:ABC transporter substrate-binding protein [Crossiella equi]MBP2476325.1 oligopeptide transport system substrate-binding protein [Crossiella equi]
MRKGRALSLVALPIAASLALTACGGGSDTGTGSGSADGAITINGTEPENPLIPGNTNEVGGGKVIDAVFSKLVRYSPTDASPQNEIAESITSSEGGTLYTIKLKSGWTFHDGTPIKAENFVKAWNYTAYAPNGQQTASFFESIEGYKDVFAKDPDGTGPQKPPTPPKSEMSGLKVVDDTTFTVKLSAPFSVFPTMVGYSAFSPLPDKFFADPAAFGKAPIGSGPFKFVSWDNGQAIKVTRYEDYKGTKPKVKDVTFKIYEKTDAAYQDVITGSLDFLDTIPTSAIAGGKYKADLAGQVIERPTLVNTTLAFPLYSDKFKNPDFRKAISLAINREEISQKIFEGSRKPATSWVVDGLKGYKEGQCEFCKFDPAKAKELLTKSGVKEDIQITYNADGDHKTWIDAACNSIKNTLGIGCQGDPVPSFQVQRQRANAKQFTSLYRTGWQADYPSIENFLNPLLRSNASSNDGDYSNPAVDAKLAEADKAPNEDEAIKLYQEAEKLISNDMPTIPMFVAVGQSAFSKNVKNVTVTPFRTLDLLSITTA